MSTRVLVPSGVLGLGFDEVALRRGIESGPDIICIDGGSTDSGPYYLGSGVSKYSRASIKAEWRILLKARDEAGVPLIIGSAGTCGTDSMVDWMLEITREIAEDEQLALNVATLKSSQQPVEIAGKFLKDGLVSLGNAPELSNIWIRECSNIVALAGVEQMIAAISTGVDVVIAGRATDTAPIAALPIMRGENIAAAWHGAKIAECGALCSTRPMSGVVAVDFDQDSFTVEALADNAECTPNSVSAHMMYENADPFILYEPGGHLDVSNARYAALGGGRVRVDGSKWVPSKRVHIKA